MNHSGSRIRGTKVAKIAAKHHQEIWLAELPKRVDAGRGRVSLVYDRVLPLDASILCMAHRTYPFLFASTIFRVNITLDG